MSKKTAKQIIDEIDALPHNIQCKKCLEIINTLQQINNNLSSANLIEAVDANSKFVIGYSILKQEISKLKAL